MHSLNIRGGVRSMLLAPFALCTFTAAAQAQVSFSIDWHSVTVGVPDSTGFAPITEGDILSPFGGAPAIGPLLTPDIAISAGPTGLGMFGWGPCVGHPGGTPCRVELDALSYGMDYPLNSSAGIMPGDLVWSTEDFALGHGMFGYPAPNLFSEAPVGDASADVWALGMGMPPGPLPPLAAPGGAVGLIDGDGLPSGSGAVYPGLGLKEPNNMGFPNIGDNLDAIDLGSPAGFPATGVYFSVDQGLFDFMSGVIGGSTAVGMGVTGADVLHTAFPGAAPTVWAAAPLLGLNLTGALDDLDALALWENGSGVFEASRTPYDWLSGATDMLLFSVRRGSPIIGAPDSIFGIPIEEGDILTTPLPTSAGGVSPFPGIFVAAENLGLMTARTFGAVGDELDALDTKGAPFSDCNGNGIDDAIDIAFGMSTDVNSNGVPDECELIVTPYCFCVQGAPCGNNFPTAGCRNSTGLGGLLTGAGTSSVMADNLVLTASQLPINKFGIIFMGTAPVGPILFGDGHRCVGGLIARFPVTNSGATGVITLGPGIVNYTVTNYVPALWITAISTWNFQGWFRDPVGPCGFGFNTTNALSITFTP